MTHPAQDEGLDLIDDLIATWPWFAAGLVCFVIAAAVSTFG